MIQDLSKTCDIAKGRQNIQFVRWCIAFEFLVIGLQESEVMELC